VLSLLVASVLFAVLFTLRLLTAAEPFLPISVLVNPVVSAGTAAACFTMGSFIGLSIYVPVYFELVIGLTASRSGLALIPLMAGVIVGATAAGRLMMHLKHYKRPPLAGMAVASLGTAILALRPDGLGLPLVEVILAAVGIGIGTLLPVTTVAIQNAVPIHQLGTATGTMNFFRSLGGAVAVAAFGAILLSGGAGAGGVTLETLRQGALDGSIDLAGLFRWLFLAAAIGFAIGLGWLVVMRELPLRSGRPAAGTSTATARTTTPAADPAAAE
jgi:MFS family permease